MKLLFSFIKKKSDKMGKIELANLSRVTACRNKSNISSNRIYSQIVLAGPSSHGVRILCADAGTATQCANVSISGSAFSVSSSGSIAKAGSETC